MSDLSAAVYCVAYIMSVADDPERSLGQCFKCLCPLKRNQKTVNISKEKIIYTFHSLYHFLSVLYVVKYCMSLPALAYAHPLLS